MKNAKRVFRWWWGWNPEKIEQWLELEEAAGWNLERISPSGLFFYFRRGNPRTVAFRIDFQPQAKDDYRQLFADAGWSLIQEGNSWFYWSQGYSGEKPDIFSDFDSLLARNRRQMWFMVIIWLVQWPSLNILLRRISETPSLPLNLLFLIQGTLFLLLTFILVSFLLADRKLKKSRGL